MAWIEKYNIEISDISNCPWYVKIYEEDASIVSEELTGSGSPIVFEYTNKSDDIFSPLKEVRANINIVTDQHFYLSDLYSYEPFTFKVDIFKNDTSTLYFSGYLNPQKYSEPYDDGVNVITIVASTGIELLSDIKYLDDTGDYYNGRKLESEIILDIFGKLGASSFKEFISNHHIESSGSPLHQTYIDVDVFKDMYCDEVLEEILMKYNAVLVHKDGYFNIYKPNELLQDVSISGRFFTDISTYTAIEYDPTQWLNRETHSSTFQQVPSGLMTIIPPAKEIEIIQDYGDKQSWINNWEFKPNTFDWDDREWDYWDHSTVSWGAFTWWPISYYINEEDTGVMLRDSVYPYGEYIYQDFGLLTTDSSSDVFTLEFDYGFYNTNGVNTYTADFIIQFLQGDKALTETSNSFCEWQSFGSGDISINESVDPSTWTGWTHYQRYVTGIPYDSSIQVRLWSSTKNMGGNVYNGIKNLKFYTTNTDIQSKKVKRKWRERWRGFKKRRPKYRTVYEIDDAVNVVEKTIIPDVSANYGIEVRNEYLLGDVTDSSLDNVLSQFQGALGYKDVYNKHHPTYEWSSEYVKNKPLLEITGDEIATQYNRPQQFLNLSIRELGDSPPTLNIIGNIIDEKNSNIPFAINRGAFNVRNRVWDLDLVEIKEPTFHLNISPTEASFGYEAGDPEYVSIAVDTNVDWDASDGGLDWISLTPRLGTSLRISCTENSNTNSRDASVWIYPTSAGTGLANQYIDVSQGGAPSSSTIIVDFSGSTTVIMNSSDEYEAYKAMVMTGRQSGDEITLNFSTTATISSSGPATATIYSSINSTSSWTLEKTFTVTDSDTFTVTGIDYNDVVRIKVKLIIIDDESDSIDLDVQVTGGSFQSGSGSIRALGTTTWNSIISP